MTPPDTVIVEPSSMTNSPSGDAVSPTCGSPSSRSIVNSAPSTADTVILTTLRSSAFLIPSLLSMRLNKDSSTATVFMLFCLLLLSVFGSRILSMKPSSIAFSMLIAVSVSIIFCRVSASVPVLSTYRLTILFCSRRNSLAWASSLAFSLSISSAVTFSSHKS